MRADAVREWLQQRRRRLGRAWFWLVALLVLHGCSLPENGIGPYTAFNPGPTPQSSTIFCDIEKMGTGWDNTSRVCADAVDLGLRTTAIPLAAAALALNTGQMSRFALDQSADAVNRCGNDGEIVEFHGPFPQGISKCLNCGSQIPAVFADANAACVALCEDMSRTSLANPPTTAVATFCASHAHVSTNFPVSGCPSDFAGACTTAGTLRTDFVDPRIVPEPVAWTDLIGVGTGGTFNNDLTRTQVSIGQFDAGAVSTQWIAGGDAYVEFAATESNLAHVIGFSALPSSCPFPCHDLDGGLDDITYAVNLGSDGRVYILQSGTGVPGLDLNGSYGTYAPGDRFRITVIDRGNGFFDVRFSKVIGICTPGLPCNEAVLNETTGGGGYPLRVDTSFQDQTATLQDVRVVRIH